jgi:hypothetical protein
MVRIILSEDIILRIGWLILLDLSFVNFDVFPLYYSISCIG